MPFRRSGADAAGTIFGGRESAVRRPETQHWRGFPRCQEVACPQPCPDPCFVYFASCSSFSISTWLQNHREQRDGGNTLSNPLSSKEFSVPANAKGCSRRPVWTGTPSASFCGGSLGNLWVLVDHIVFVHKPKVGRPVLKSEAGLVPIIARHVDGPDIHLLPLLHNRGNRLIFQLMKVKLCRCLIKVQEENCSNSSLDFLVELRIFHSFQRLKELVQQLHASDLTRLALPCHKSNLVRLKFVNGQCDTTRGNCTCFSVSVMRLHRTAEVPQRFVIVAVGRNCGTDSLLGISIAHGLQFVSQLKQACSRVEHAHFNVPQLIVDLELRIDGSRHTVQGSRSTTEPHSLVDHRTRATLNAAAPF